MTVRFVENFFSIIIMMLFLKTCFYLPAVLCRTNSGLPLHLNTMDLPSGTSERFISILAIANTSAEADKLLSKLLTVDVAAYAPLTPNAPVNRYENPARLKIKFSDIFSSVFYYYISQGP